MGLDSIVARAVVVAETIALRVGRGVDGAGELRGGELRLRGRAAEVFDEARGDLFEKARGDVYKRQVQGWRCGVDRGADQGGRGAAGVRFPEN